MSAQSYDKNCLSLVASTRPHAAVLNKSETFNFHQPSRSVIRFAMSDRMQIYRTHTNTQARDTRQALRSWVWSRHPGGTPSPPPGVVSSCNRYTWSTLSSYVLLNDVAYQANGAVCSPWNAKALCLLPFEPHPLPLWRRQEFVLTAGKMV